MKILKIRGPATSCPTDHSILQKVIQEDHASLPSLYDLEIQQVEALHGGVSSKDGWNFGFLR